MLGEILNGAIVGVLMFVGYVCLCEFMRRS